MNRFQNSLAVARQSWNVLCANPSLAIFPVISAFGTVLVSIPFIVPMVMVAMGKSHHVPVSGPIGILLSFLFYFATYTVVFFCNAALVSCAQKSLTGQATTPGEGIQNALNHLPAIIGWAFVSATVGQLFKMIQQRAGILGAVAGGLLGIAWNITVSFVVPIIVLENKGPIDAVKGSIERLKTTWGEQLILNVGMNMVSVLSILPVAVLVCASVAAFIGHLIPLGVILLIASLVYVLVASIIISTLSTIFKTALYVYSATGTIPAAFDQRLVESAFIQKKSKLRR